jgi:hypothetical protein
MERLLELEEVQAKYKNKKKGELGCKNNMQGQNKKCITIITYLMILKMNMAEIIDQFQIISL